MNKYLESSKNIFIGYYYWGFPGSSDGKASAYNAGDPGSIPRSGRFPWRRKWQPTPVLLPGKSHGLRSLVGYSPWGCKESDMTERLHFHFITNTRSRQILALFSVTSLPQRTQSSGY